MLIRLKVSGFKNLMDVDVRFGPFTCIAGANGVGKSNLLDAIAFLSALADKTLLEAATTVRDESGRYSDIKNLFHRIGQEFERVISFEAEMIVPGEGIDDLGQPAKATITCLRYALSIAHRSENGLRSGNLEILKEELIRIKKDDAVKELSFARGCADWKNSILTVVRRGAPFISTEGEGAGRIVKLHQDRQKGGRTRQFSAGNLPRTVLSTVQTTENPTIMLARREMQSWRLLQLEPSALRKPDAFSAPSKLGFNGAHLAATLHRIAKTGSLFNEEKSMDEDIRVYTRMANRLAELIDDVQTLRIDEDQKRELLTLEVAGRDGAFHPAHSLSDGTLRFLALSTLELDPETGGVICLEEPENGIHPERIPAMIRLLSDIATDIHYRVGADNPFRQVIVSTHSPAVVAQVPDDSLLIAELRERLTGGKRSQTVRFSCLPKTWRADFPDRQISGRGSLLSYLNPVNPREDDLSTEKTRKSRPRVCDRSDLQKCFPFHKGGE